MYKNPINYYFRSGVCEGVLAFTLLLLIPTDPKNAWLLGYSKTRLLLSIPLLLLILLFLCLSIAYSKKPEFAEKLCKKIDGILDIYGLSLPILMLWAGLFIIGPYLKNFTYFPIDAIKIRVLPFILYLLSRFFQLFIVLLAINRSRRERGLQWRISERNIRPLLLTITGILITTHISTFVLHKLTQETDQFKEFRQIHKYFNVTYELNLPAFYSALLLGVAGCILCAIAIYKIRQKARFRFQWFLLGIIFLYLSSDELLAKHESLGYLADKYIGKENLVFQDWAYAGIVLVILFVVLFLPFFNHLESGHKLRFFLSGAIYVGGALGVEILGSIYEMRRGIQEIPYLLFTTSEETLEMVGMVFFIYTLTVYLNETKQLFKRKQQ